MSIAPPGHETPDASPPAPLSHKDAKAHAAAAKAYAKAQRPWYRMKRWWVAGLLVVAFAGLRSSGDDATSSDMTGGIASQAAAPSGAGEPSHDEDTTFKNGVLTTTDMQIKILRHEVIGDGEPGNEYGDKPVIAFWYETTNLSGKDVDSADFMFYFEAYQDNDPNVVNELDTAIGTDLDSGDDHGLLEKIKKGGTVRDVIAYELDDLTTPVELVATDDLLGDEVGKAAYALY